MQKQAKQPKTKKKVKKERLRKFAYKVRTGIATEAQTLAAIDIAAANGVNGLKGRNDIINEAFLNWLDQNKVQRPSLDEALDVIGRTGRKADA